MDPSTADALALFNQRLTVQSDAERSERRIIKQTKIKDGAAAAVRAIEADTNATAEARNAAIEAYKEAVAALDRAKRGEPDRPPTESTEGSGTPSDETASQDHPAADDVPADVATADEPESRDDATGAPATDL